MQLWLCYKIHIKQLHLLSTLEHSCKLDNVLITFCLKHHGHNLSSSNKLVSNKCWKCTSSGPDCAIVACYRGVPEAVYFNYYGLQSSSIGWGRRRDVCLADSFIGKCLFRVSLSAWHHLLPSFHFGVLSLCQLSFTSVSKQRERDKEERKRIAEMLSLSLH